MKTVGCRHLLLALVLMISLCSRASVVAAKADKLNAKVNAELSLLPSLKDSASYYSCVANAILLAIECDKADTLGRFRRTNSEKLLKLRQSMLGSALSSADYSQSVLKRLFNVYIESAPSPLFLASKVTAGEAALRICRKAMSLKQYDMAEYYADRALLYADYASQAAEVKVKCMGQHLRSAADSTAYLMALLELHDRQPDNEVYYGLLLDVLTAPGREGDLVKFANDVLHKDSTDTRAWILKGEAAMRRHKWDDAVAAYTKADGLHHSLGIDYNLGICLSSKALELKDSLVDSRGRLSRTDRPKVRKFLDKACSYMEKVKEGDPEQKQFHWAKPLYLIYYAIGRRSKAKEIKELMKD